MKVLVITVVTLFTCIVAVPLSHHEQRVPKPSRIFGGQNAERYEYPYIVSIQMDNGSHFIHVCGGSIITTTVVLTAAHCIIINEPSLYKVVAGMLNFDENHPDVQNLAVFLVQPHEDYDISKPLVNDFAFVVLQKKIKWSKAVQPVNLPRANTYPTGDAIATGWGVLSEKTNEKPTTLQQATLHIITHARCTQSLGKIIDDKVVCTGLSGGGDTCKGDSGGPLVQNNTLVGITSGGVIDCGDNRLPSVFTNPSKFMDTLRSYVKDLPEN